MRKNNIMSALTESLREFGLNHKEWKISLDQNSTFFSEDKNVVLSQVHFSHLEDEDLRMTGSLVLSILPDLYFDAKISHLELAV